MLKGFPVFDLDRIEVLRGPQGTLFGRNTPAGAIKFESVRPTETLEGYGRVSYGRFNSVNLREQCPDRLCHLCFPPGCLYWRKNEVIG